MFVTLHDFLETDIACVSLDGGGFIDIIAAFWKRHRVCDIA